MDAAVLQALWSNTLAPLLTQVVVAVAGAWAGAKFAHKKA